MKQIALILLIHVYFLSIFGLGVKQFYCCGNLESTSFSFLQDDNKKCGKEDKQTDCCKTKYQIFKVKDTHLAADGINSLAKPIAHQHIVSPSFELTIWASEPKCINNKIHAPPVYPNTSIYILHCVYRI